MRIGEVVDAVAFEHERPLDESLLRQIVEDDRFTFDLRHVRLELCAEDFVHRPVEICAAVLVDQHARIDSAHALDRRRLRLERPIRLVRNGHADLESAALLGSGAFGDRRKVEVVLAIFEDGIGCPHGIRRWIGPFDIRLLQDHSMVRPVREIVGREDVIVLHDEPVRSALVLGRRFDVVGGIDIDLSLEHARGRVGGELICDQWVGRKHGTGLQCGRSGNRKAWQELHVE